MYDTSHYRAWASMSGVHIDVIVHKHDIVMLGERQAVGHAVWEKLFSDFSYRDVNGKNILVKNPTGDILRKWAKALGESGASQLKEIMMRDLRYSKVTIDKEA